MIYGTAEVADDPSHKCQNNTHDDTGECAVCGDDAPTADQLLRQLYNACGYGVEMDPVYYGRLCRYLNPPTDTEKMIGRLNAPLDDNHVDDEWMNAPMGSPDAPTTRECPRCGAVMGLLKPEKDAPPDAIEKMQHELEVGRANDRYFNEKLDYIGEMKEEIQQQIDSHTTIVHGEIERRLTEMGQKIDALEKEVSAAIKLMTQWRCDESHGQDHIDLQQQIKKLEQRISGEKGEE